MIGLVVSVVVAGSVAASVALLGRPRPRDPLRSRDLDARPPADRVGRGPLASLGRLVRRLAGRPADPVHDRSVGRRVVVITGCTLVAPLIGLVVAFSWWVASMMARRRRTQRRDDAIADGLADVIDLFAVGLLSGRNITATTRDVSLWIDGELGEQFRRCGERVDRGRTIADALEDLAAETGPPIRPLVAALVASERYGAPITHGLSQLAADSRADRHRRAEAAARRLPVVLLFPLVVCVLPAFLLVTVIPVVIDTLSAFDSLGSP